MTKWRRQKTCCGCEINFFCDFHFQRARMDGHVADQHDHDLLDVASYYCSKQDFFLMEP